MKQNQYSLFRKYCLSLPRGYVYFNREKDTLFESLIDYWKDVRPRRYNHSRIDIESGVYDDGLMSQACSLHYETTEALSKFYKKVHDFQTVGGGCKIPRNINDILVTPNDIKKYYPGNHANPIFAACFFNTSAYATAWSIKLGYNYQFDFALKVLKAADGLIPDSRDIQKAFTFIKQTEFDLKKKDEERKLKLEEQRKREEKGFFAKLFGL